MDANDRKRIWQLAPTHSNNAIAKELGLKRREVEEVLGKVIPVETIPEFDLPTVQPKPVPTVRPKRQARPFGIYVARVVKPNGIFFLLRQQYPDGKSKQLGKYKTREEAEHARQQAIDQSV